MSAQHLPAVDRGRRSFGASSRRPLMALMVLGPWSQATWVAATPTVEHRAVAISGQQAPGLAPGVLLLDPFPETTFLSSPRIDSAGRVISFIAMGGAGTSSSLGGNGQSIWAEGEPGGELALLARQGDHAPGTEPTTAFEGFPSPLQPGTPSMSVGRTTFSASLRGPGIIFGQTNNAFGIFSSGPGPLTLLARSGSHAPGLPPSVIFGPSVGNPFTGGIINTSGHVLHGAFLGGPGVSSANSESLWSDRSGVFELVLRGGDPAPGTAAVFGASPESFSPGGLRNFAFNNRSRMALYGNLTGAGIDFLNDEGVWVEGPAGLELLAREGAPAPGTPWAFGEGGVSDQFVALTFNHEGKVAFRAGLGAGSMVSGVATLWTNRSGPLQMIVGPGINQPGVVAGSVTGASLYSLSHASRIAFLAGILPPGQIFSTDSAVWSDRSGAMELLVHSGDPAPGTGGAVFGSFFVLDGRDFFRLAAGGALGFRARLSGAGVSVFNDLAYYISDNAGRLHLILRQDDLFDVGAAQGGAPGVDVRRIIDMLPGAMNDQGEWAFKVLFDDGKIAIITAKLAPTSIPADLNGDGHVNGLDLAQMLAQWTGSAPYAPCPPHRPADLNQDCSVNGLDLAALLAQWG